MNNTPPSAVGVGPGEPAAPASRIEPVRDAVFTPLTPHDPHSVSSYLLRARIGEGGMGAVYLSYTPGGRPIALKVARPELAADPDFRSRFAKEVAIARRVQGPYTVPVIDADAEALRPWIATAYVAAPSLAVAVVRQGALPSATVLMLIAGVAEALQSIHRSGVIHRDLKPGNVILADDGPRVIDFGVARAIETSTAAMTQTGVRIGTPAFMSPEQVRGKQIDAAGDVFALGSTAYYALTGRPPFGSDAAVFHRIEHQQPDWEHCPDNVREVLSRCLAKDPAERPTSTQVIELCRSAITDDLYLQTGGGWLPPTVAAEVTRYRISTVPSPTTTLQPVPPSTFQSAPTGAPDAMDALGTPFPSEPAPTDAIPGPHPSSAPVPHVPRIPSSSPVPFVSDVRHSPRALAAAGTPRALGAARVPRALCAPRVPRALEAARAGGGVGAEETAEGAGFHGTARAPGSSGSGGTGSGTGGGRSSGSRGTAGPGGTAGIHEVTELDGATGAAGAPGSPGSPEGGGPASAAALGPPPAASPGRARPTADGSDGPGLTGPVGAGPSSSEADANSADANSADANSADANSADGVNGAAAGGLGGDDGLGGDGPPRQSRRRRRRRFMTVLLAVLAIAGAVCFWLLSKPLGGEPVALVVTPSRAGGAAAEAGPVTSPSASPATSTGPTGAAGARPGAGVTTSPTGLARATSPPVQGLGCPARPVTRANSDGAGVLTGVAQLREGPADSCDSVATFVRGRKFWLWCSVVTKSDDVWWWARLDGTETYGWIRENAMRIDYVDDDGDGKVHVYNCDGKARSW
ncbi:serine/threonine protein kinase [Frankia sp. EI5c]|uniref:serine/threonine-protein kinase n=1 Tax=Frankia sp. EI5c TaxID=683316 RepID=UPI0007C3937B|nr:serine/threonine-protein kinase [Frankia sp. EI5c]OAA23268.1 serine/threonine protein kinase [Frankia sp. EI5c]